MNWLDVVILVVGAVSTFSGLKVGIIKATLSLGGLIFGIILAGNYYALLAAQLSFIPQAGVAEGVAFVIILIGVILIANIAARLLESVTSAVMLGWVNYIGGAAFGLALGATLCGALLATWIKFFGISEVLNQSAMAAILLDRFPIVLTLFPDEFDAIRSFFE